MCCVVVVDCACARIGSCDSTIAERLSRQTDGSSERLGAFDDGVVDCRDRDRLTACIGIQSDLLSGICKVSNALSRDIGKGDIDQHAGIELFVRGNREDEVSTFCNRCVTDCDCGGIIVCDVHGGCC